MMNAAAALACATLVFCAGQQASAQDSDAPTVAPTLTTTAGAGHGSLWSKLNLTSDTVDAYTAVPTLPTWLKSCIGFVCVAASLYPLLFGYRLFKPCLFLIAGLPWLMVGYNIGTIHIKSVYAAVAIGVFLFLSCGGAGLLCWTFICFLIGCTLGVSATVLCYTLFFHASSGLVYTNVTKSWNGTSKASQGALTSGIVDMYINDHDVVHVSTEIMIVLALSVVIGLGTGFIALKAQKPVIIMTTSYVGAFIGAASIFWGFRVDPAFPSSLAHFNILSGVAAVGSTVQYAFTSVGYDHRKINAKSKSDLHTRAKALASGKFGAAFKAPVSVNRQIASLHMHLLDDDDGAPVLPPTPVVPFGTFGKRRGPEIYPEIFPEIFPART